MFSEKAVKHLRKIEQFILNEPRRFNMFEGVAQAALVKEQLENPPCGTACCIAGASYLIRQKVSVRKMLDFVKENQCSNGRSGNINWFTVLSTSVEAMDLSTSEANKLFYTESWPTKFQKMYSDATTPMERACAGVLRIEHFIKTKFTQ